MSDRKFYDEYQKLKARRGRGYGAAKMARDQQEEKYRQLPSLLLKREEDIKNLLAEASRVYEWVSIECFVGSSKVTYMAN